MMQCTSPHSTPHHTRSAQIAPKTTIFLSKTIHFAIHTTVDLKDRFCEVAKILTQSEGFRWEVLHVLKIADNPITV